jgi:uncharacterized protein
MGHRHTPEEFLSARGIYRAPVGASPRPARRHETAPVTPAATSEATTGVTTGVGPQSVSVRAALFALHFYKAYLSILMAGSCRYQPTCSQFTYEAIARFGVLRGSWLGFLRLLRCQPFSRRFGFDPVPEEWRGSSDVSTHKEAHS